MPTVHINSEWKQLWPVPSTARKANDLDAALQACKNSLGAIAKRTLNGKIAPPSERDCPYEPGAPDEDEPDDRESDDDAWLDSAIQIEQKCLAKERHNARSDATAVAIIVWVCLFLRFVFVVWPATLPRAKQQKQ